MGRKTGAIELPIGVMIRDQATGPRIQIAFSWMGKQCRELLPPAPINKGSIQYASNLRSEIRRKITDGTFKYGDYFPESPRAAMVRPNQQRVGVLLERQRDTYERQVKNGKLSPSTFAGYAKAISSERMKRWRNVRVNEVTPSDLRDWISGMECTSKFIRNLMIPLRSVLEDALNDGLIEFNPFERIALGKLIRQTAKASDYVIDPYSAEERMKLLSACRADERPMVQFWFATGLRPGELQALSWSDIDLKAKVAKITQNQVAGVIKAPKTAAGRREVDLNKAATEALHAQRALSPDGGGRIWLNPSTRAPWTTDAQLRKTLWQPLCKRAGIKYRNPYQVRHTYASVLLTAGHNPWYVAAQLGHEDVEMVFRTYGKFIREDYQKPKTPPKTASGSV